ncbi:Hsp33 family molecular chaperone HslO [Geomicrobium sp. JCM 19039]|uniref:Hsp33 family molecular chaperone HslO n=1 Tax=Geomicrobium sp. JCM 19039 TaxID=1460636 RepID=UPI00045F2511|nr:Hsp33 family molecular chaperone HslO [Geomicrobium sp. JCM 19039]GAK13918.1 chaperonin [Geomicrobium sp. JCM 19039]
MKDYLVKASAYDNQIRIYAAAATNMVNEAVGRHGVWPTAAAALGRTMITGTMMGAMLKGEDKVTIKVEGDGPVGPIIVDSDAHGNTRGYVYNPAVHFDLNANGKLDVARAVGTNGHIAITKNLGMKEQFTGHSPIVSGELGEDFTYYFAKSEQIPSSVGVGVLVDTDHSIKAAGGFILQVMPGADDATVTKVEQQIGAMPPVSKLIERGDSPEQIIATVTGGEYKKLETMDVAFKCECSRERIARAIVSLGSDEIQSMIEEDGGAETQCHFCNEKYDFNEVDLQELKDEANAH